MRFLIPIVWALAMFASRFADPLPVIFLAAVTLAVVVAWRERESMRMLLRVTPSIAGLAAIATIAMLAVTYLAYPIVSQMVPAIAREAHEIEGRFIAGRNVALLIAAVVPVVVAEELLWRGAFQQSLRRWSVVVAALTYAIAHAPAGSLLLVVVAFLCGLYWSALRAISRSLVPSLCAHLAWDVALIVFPLVRR